MKMKLSLNNLLHSEKFLLVVSLILSIFIWSMVVYGPNNEETRTVAQVPVSVSLGSYAQSQGLRIIGGDTMTATVTVFGRRSEVEWLTASDFTLTVNTGTIVQAGTYENIAIQAIKSNASADYEVVEIFPQSVSVSVDYWETRTFPVTAEANGVTAVADGVHRLGEMQLESAAFVGNTITIEGPRSELDSIHTVVARVSETKSLSQTEAFTASLVALDADGRDADIPNCTFINPSNSPVTVTVPVEEYQTVTLSATVANPPTGFAFQDPITVTPGTIGLWGTPQAISDFAAQNAELLTYDFRTLNENSFPLTETLIVPDNVELEGEVAQVEVSSPIWSQYSLMSQQITLPLTASNVTFTNLPSGYTAELAASQWVTVTVCGEVSMVNLISASNLTATIDLKQSTAASARYEVQVNVSGDHVWVYDAEPLEARVRITAAD